jgi:plastocyanin
MKKIIILIVVLVILGFGFYLFNKNQAKAPVVTSSNNVQETLNNQPIASTTVVTTTAGTVENTPAPLPPKSQAGGGETPGSNIQVVEVDFNGTAFSPATVSIHQNDWVFFKNKSTVDFWPQSTTSGIFDAGAAIAPGKEFKFQFTKVGSWVYTDHLAPSIGGTVVVQ